MSYLKSSFIFTLFYSVWVRLVSLYHASSTSRLLSRCCAWLQKKWNESFVVHLFYDEGRISLSWQNSALLHVTDWILDLPLRLLHGIYRILQKPLENSFFATLAFEIGKEAFLAAAWFIALILCIPYSAWNNAYSVLLFAFVLMLVFLGGMDSLSARLSFRDFGPYLLFFFFAVVISVPLSDYTSLSGRYLVYHLSCFLVMISMVNAVTNSRQLLRLAGGLGLGVLAASAYGLYQWAVIGVEVNPTFVDLSANADMPGRVYSYFANPNAFAELLMMALPILVALMFVSRHWWSKIGAAAVFAVGLLCLGLTYSRGSWVGLAVAAFVYVFLWNRRLVPVGLIACILLLPLLPDSIFNRILSITNMKDTSISSRFPQYEAVIKLLWHDPVTGAGLGADAVRESVKLQAFYQGTSPFVHAHNTFLQIWAETGLLGIVSFLASVLWTMKSTARAVKTTSDSAARHLAIGGISAILGAMVCGLADYLWTYPRIMFVFWFVFGLTLAAIKVCKMESDRV